ncbi:MAG: tRNA (adenosine(37)-N6)-dimethylallyltransferase MiaA [Candidatus Omnitrophota bacterium]
MNAGRKVLFIVGPTSVGKTAFSVRLAKRIDGEIISSDSMQAYRYMDILSQKPTDKERGEVPHYLIDFLDPTEEYSAARFAEEARRCIEEIIDRGKMPIIVGGSGLYVRALVEGLFPAPKKDARLREGLEEEAARCGPEFLHDRLKEADPETASKIHPNDTRRVVRALEIISMTGIPVSEHKKNTSGIMGLFDIRIYGLARNREGLNAAIGERVDKMFSEGLVEEVKILKRKTPGLTAGSSIGYKEVVGYIDGKYALEEAKELLNKNTRRLVKKQMTWFRADKSIKWIDRDNMSDEAALEFIEKDIKI